MLEQSMHLNTCAPEVNYSQEYLINNRSPNQNGSHAQPCQIQSVLAERVANLKASVGAKEGELRELKEKIKVFYVYQRKRKELQQREKKIQSQLEDLQMFQEKLKKEIRILIQEEQIKKGKAIVEHNRISEIKAEQQRQLERKSVLQKHLEEMKRGGESLKIKVKTIKEELKKKNQHKNHIEQPTIKCQIKQLEHIRQKAEDTLQKIRQKKKTRSTSQLYIQMEQKYHKLQEQCLKMSQIQALNIRLKNQKQALQQRINFLQSVGTSFIDSKKSLLQELTHKLQILQTQKLCYAQQLNSLETQLNKMKQLHNQELSMTKKHLRKKREPHSKTQKRAKAPQNDKLQDFVRQVENKPAYRWKGKSLRRLCFLTFTLLLVLGLLLGSVSSILFDITS